ncbi:hypothetical protein SGQ44_05785 [Flavobacterium sp. Fl-77]|uniref:Uncharacterized protein n=1 Tax=Flavobacterium flavipigmentatum TaxID=2893884 RepID=A0AAJ2SCG4_9FLAO|nr:MULTISPECIES: hypothetical protein [unclassified Flavobacterium]MDX6181709.1 hypothetical protein [Flavobacterium sp. Fl-33]MDX6185257.1 hypothetical protein [Flavobacterium sp. Fl-77]UFH37363.1 hypothetical protein LNP22_11515 [Flavobacterium sp. F-70]
MKKIQTTIIILTLFPFFSIAQSIIVLENKNFQGAIFPKTYTNSAYNWLDKSDRFSPTTAEVEKFENALRSKLKKINTNLWDQQNSCPIIHRNLKKYIRQYLGFIDESGKKYLLVNFLWNKSFQENTNDPFYNELGD